MKVKKIWKDNRLLHIKIKIPFWSSYKEEQYKYNKMFSDEFLTYLGTCPDVTAKYIILIFALRDYDLDYALRDYDLDYLDYLKYFKKI